jgi:hypothetical protein
LTGLPSKSLLNQGNEPWDRVDRECESHPGLHPLNRRSVRGQELVEFALTFPILILFVYGIFEVGRIFHVMIAISNAAREAGRYGMAYGIIRSIGNVYSIDEATIDAAAVKEAGNYDLQLTAAEVTPSCIPNPCVPGGRLRIVVTYMFKPITSMIFPTAGLNLEQDMEMVIP